MSALRLSSSNSDVVLEFTDVEDDHFRVAVTSRDHSATRRVYAFPDRRGVARLFEDAAAQWTGWEGVKAWQSLEGELRIELSVDPVGHVTVAVRVRSDAGVSDAWQLDAELGIDAGQLGGVAQEASRLWCDGG